MKVRTFLFILLDRNGSVILSARGINYRLCLWIGWSENGRVRYQGDEIQWKLHTKRCMSFAEEKIIR